MPTLNAKGDFFVNAQYWEKAAGSNSSSATYNAIEFYGGGGGSLNGTNSGAGGNGADGYAIVIEYF